MKAALDWMAMIAMGSLMVVATGFVMKGYYLLFMLGWGVL